MSFQTTRVLVTGGAGFIGSHLVRALCRAGHHVRVLDDLSTGSRERLAGLAVDFLQGDVRQPQMVRRAMEGVSVVFHLASVRTVLDGERPLWRAEEVNVGGALNVLDAARETRLQRVVIASTGDVYGRAAALLLHEDVAPVPVTPEGLQHLTVEHYARLYREAYRVPVVLLRLFSTFGPGETLDGPGLIPRLCRAALLGAAPVIEGDPRQTRDLVYVENVVPALLAAASVPSIEGAVFNVASGEAVSVAWVWQTLCDITGRPRLSLEPSYVPMTHWEQTNVRVSIQRAARTLAYAPAVKLRDALQRTLDGYRGMKLSLPQEEPNSWFTPPGEVAQKIKPVAQRLWPAGEPPPPPQVAPAHLTPSVVQAIAALTPASVAAVAPTPRAVPAVTPVSVPGVSTATGSASGASHSAHSSHAHAAHSSHSSSSGTGYATFTAVPGGKDAGGSRSTTGTGGAGRPTPPTLPAVPKVMPRGGARPPAPPLSLVDTTHEAEELDADELLVVDDEPHVGGAR